MGPNRQTRRRHVPTGNIALTKDTARTRDNTRTENTAPGLRVRDRNADTFEGMYRRHVGAVTRVVAARTRDRGAVEDLVQDVFCAVLADPALIGADVRGCLLRLAARACTRHTLAQRHYLQAAYTIYRDQAGIDETSQPTTVSPAAPNRQRLAHALTRLSDDQRRVVQLRYLAGDPHETVAAVMNRTIGAVKTLEQQALRNLRRWTDPIH